MLHLYYGRENIDKENFIFDHLQGRALLLVPDQFTLQMERALLARAGKEALMDIEVLSMSRLGDRLLSELGGSKRSFIDKYGRHMILSDVARAERERLQVFRGLERKNSFIEMVNNFISELKQFNCGSAELTQIAEALPEDSYAAKKLTDLTLLYESYERRIEGKYTDSEDYIDLFLSKIAQSALIQDQDIWIYGFDSFAPKAMSVIGELMRSAREVQVVLTADHDRSSRDSELFTLPELVMHKLQEVAEVSGIDCKRQAIPECYRIRDRAAAVRQIEQELYALPARPAKDLDACEGLRLVTAANLYNEAESAAVYVLHLVRDLGYHYHEIQLICNDQQERGPILRRIFREYGIDLISDASRDILQSPIVRYITAQISVVIEKYRTDTVLRVLKSGFSDLTADEVTDLENYVIQYRVRGSMWKRPFVKGLQEYGEEELKRLDALRESAIAPMRSFEKIFQRETTADFIAALYQYFYQEARLPERIGELIRAQEEMGREDLAEETRQIWGKVIGILDQMQEIAGQQDFDARAFLDLFKVGLSQVELGVLPPTKDGLMMGTMQRTRSGNIKALVVVGANEGILPQDKPAQGLFGDEEKELFRQKGVELCKVDSVRQMEERLAIYRNLSRPRAQLWMSCSMADIEGNLSKPSGVFTKLIEIFPQLAVEKDILNRTAEAQTELACGGMAPLRHLTEALQDTLEGKPLGTPWREMLTWYQQHDDAKLTPIRKGLAFTNKQEALGRQVADALYQRDVDTALSLSPSRLERYARCAFSHLIQYGLKPEERRVFEVAPREIGDIYHRCLMELTAKLTLPDVPVTAPESPWMTLTREACRNFVEQTVARETSNYREGLFQLGHEEQYRSRRIADICEKVCWVCVEQVRAGQILSSRFEVPFGRGRAIPPIAVEAEGRQIFIEGKIDRVDILRGERVKIIDYKTGNENFSKSEAETGYRLQLMLYLNACLGEHTGGAARKPAGVFYFHISEPMVDWSAKEPDAEKLAQEVRKNFKMNGVLVDDPQVIESIAGDFSGYSEILPLRNGKDGVSATGGDTLLSETEFAALTETVSQKVTELCRDLAAGKIDIEPMKTRDRSACTYCQYKGICRFDTIFEGCRWRIV